MALPFPEGTTALATDSEQRSLQKICELVAGGGGGGGGGATQVFAGNYGGGVPTDTPTTSAAIATDTSNGAQWNWYGGAWH